MSCLKTLAESRVRWMLPVPMIAQMTAMLIMASHGRPQMTAPVPDGLLHVLAYTVLGLTSWLAWHAFNPRGSADRLRRAGPLTAAVFGVLDEGIQLASPDRAAQLSDIGADIAGSALSLLLIYLIARVFPAVSDEASK